MNQKQVRPGYNDRSKPFRVDAGRIEGPTQERNYKFCDAFATLEEAQAACASCAGYDFIDLHYVDPDGFIFNVVLEPVEA